VVSKGGAEGVLAIGLPRGALPANAPFGDGPMGIAATIEDGNWARRAGDAVSGEVLSQLGLDGASSPALAALSRPPIVDPRGAIAGEVRTAFSLR
jgi:L-asparaginase II